MTSADQTRGRADSPSPEVAELIATFEQLQMKDFSELTVGEARTVLASMAADPPSEPVIHEITEHRVPRPGHPIPIRIYRPSRAEDLPVLVWFHGGGWVLGDLDSGEIPCRALASMAECVVVSVDYRLAPETPFPGAIDDCIAATRWIAASAAELRIDGTRLAVGGDSAGGNLAAAVALDAATNGPTLAHQLLVYPVVDADFTTASYGENAEGYLLTRAGMQWFWDHYASPEQRSEPLAAPINGEFAGLASAWVFTAGFDPLRDEGLAYADALETAGVAVERLHQPGSIHGVFAMPLDCGAQARAAAADSLRRAFERAH